MAKNDYYPQHDYYPQRRGPAPKPPDYTAGFFAGMLAARQAVLDNERQRMANGTFSRTVGGIERTPAPPGLETPSSDRQGVWLNLVYDLCQKSPRPVPGVAYQWTDLAAPLMDQADKESTAAAARVGAQHVHTLNELAECRLEAEKNEAALVAAGAALDKIAGDCAILRTERDGLKVLRDQAKADLRRARREAEELNDATGRLSSLVESERDKCSRAYRQRNEAQIEVGRVQAEVNRMTTYTDDLTNRMNECESQRGAIRVLATKRQVEIERLKDDVTRLRAIIAPKVPLSMSHPEVYARLKASAKALLKVSAWPEPASSSVVSVRVGKIRTAAEDIRDAIGYGDEPSTCDQCGQETPDHG